MLHNIFLYKWFKDFHFQVMAVLYSFYYVSMIVITFRLLTYTSY